MHFGRVSQPTAQSTDLVGVEAGEGGQGHVGQGFQKAVHVLLSDGDLAAGVLRGVHYPQGGGLVGEDPQHERREERGSTSRSSTRPAGTPTSAIISRWISDSRVPALS